MAGRKNNREVEVKHRRPGFVLCLMIIALGCMVANYVSNELHRPPFAILSILVSAVVGFAIMGPIERYVAKNDPSYSLDFDEDDNG